MNKKGNEFDSKNQKSGDSYEELTQEDISLFVKTKFTEVKDSNSIKNLVSFQTMNKFLIMAHNQEELKVMGRIVASNNKKNLSEILIEYEKHLKLTLKSKPTIQTHSNVMMHIFGFFSKGFSILEKDKFFELQDDYKNEKITIGEILAKINPTIYRFNKIYLTSQTYFLLYSNPDPRNIFKILKKEEELKL